ncbi:MAG: GatB/YqeY domain-containing protein [Syntrophales bacterium]|nr:GatB/YqeY domain-containing protein [Syntrophales bacterium]
MTFKTKIDQDMSVAAKAKDKMTLSALRLIKTALHNREIDLKREVNDTEFLQILSGMVKQRKDSIEQFARGGRADLVEKEEAELKIIQAFMPQQLSEEDVLHEIRKAIDETGAVSVKDMGKVMKVLMPKLTGKADGKLVGEKVKAVLSA